MPPLTPASTKPMPSAASCSPWRIESRKFEFPPSTTTSSGASSRCSSAMASSVGEPEGIMTHTARGPVPRASTRAARSGTSLVAGSRS
jgi:hypothetical protein